jgi:DNA polymerase II small subunit
MDEVGRLQKAVETTMAAGYQIDRDAFDYLSTLCSTEDPEAVMNKALAKIESLEEKPMFICRSLLEEVFQEPQPQQSSPEEAFSPTANMIIHKLEKRQERELPIIQSPNCAYAKDVESQIDVLVDPTGKLSSNGTMEEFMTYFQDRFKRVEKILRQRMDVKAATPISEALKSQPKTKMKIIGMVTEKRDAKQQLLITLEDPHAIATVLVPLKAPEEVQRKAQILLPDQVVCIAVTKTRGHLFLAEDIIFPEVGQKPLRRASEPVYAVLTSDIHVGSNKFNIEAFKRFIKWLNGQYGNEQMREIASHVKYLLIAGDIVDGVGVFPGQARELNIRDVHSQYKFALKGLARVPDHIEIVVSPGNHDAPRKALPQPAISEDYMPTLLNSRRIYSLGNPCTVSLHGVEVLMYHGRSLDDIIGAVPGTDHMHPEKAMRLLMQGRHLAPIYGGKTTLSPENRDFMVVDRVPDIFHGGHIHVLGMCNYRGVMVVNSGGWQEQTDYMAKLGLVPTPGKVPVVNLQTMEATVLSFKEEP